AWLVNAFVKPDRLFGLQVGGALYGDRVTLATKEEFDEQIIAAHAVWQKETPEVVFEYAAVRHENRQNGVVAWTPAFYPGRPSPQGEQRALEAVLPVRAHRCEQRRRH